MLGSYLATNSLLSADRVVVTLKKFVSLLHEKYGKDNIIHIPHGTLGRRVESVSNGKTILSFGFWRESKNLPLLIEVFKELSEKDKGLKLVIAGSSHPNFPSYLAKIKQKFKNLKNISFTGYVPVDQIDKIFTSSTIVVLPYTAATGTSGVVHLAASYGLPVIISDLPEIRETMEEENLSLWLVPKNDKKALKLAIKNLLNDKKLRQEIGRKNLKAAEELSFFK